MIDGIKSKHIELGNQTLLDWNLSVRERGGEIHSTKTAEYRGLKFTAKCSKLFVRGSLHKYFNSGLHNYNDFHYNDLVNVVSDLTEKFSIDPANVLLENVEFGVNVRLPFPVERVLSSIILHKGEPFFRFSNVGSGGGVECKHAQFYIKVYDKGAQYTVGANLLRVEIRVIKMAYFHGKNIKLDTLSDLLELNTLKELREALINTVKEILFTDLSLSLDSSPEKERLILANGSNSNYWTNLKPNSGDFPRGNSDPNYETRRKKYYRELERFEKLLEKRQSNLKETVTRLVRDKFTDLLNISNPEQIEIEPIKKGTNLPTCINSTGEQITEPIIEKGTNLHRVYSVSLSPTEKRACLSCGNDINHLKKGARFCSKKCKNDYTNPRLNPANSLKNRIKKIEGYPLLFSIDMVVQLTAEQLRKTSEKNTIFNKV